MIDLDAIEARCEAAEPGPWRWDSRYKVVWGSQGGSIASHFRCEPFGSQSGTFIAHARTDVPRLIADLRAKNAEVERLRAENAALVHGLKVATQSYRVDL